MSFARTCALVVVLVVPAAGVSAQPIGVAPSVGAPVRDASGASLGRIEAVITDANGRPVQVVVRTRGVAGVRSRSRAVPVESLRADGGGFVTPLRRAEFDLLPPVRR